MVAGGVLLAATKSIDGEGRFSQLVSSGGRSDSLDIAAVQQHIDDMRPSCLVGDETGLDHIIAKAFNNSEAAGHRCNDPEGAMVPEAAGHDGTVAHSDLTLESAVGESWTRPNVAGVPEGWGGEPLSSDSCNGGAGH